MLRIKVRCASARRFWSFKLDLLGCCVATETLAFVDGTVRISRIRWFLVDQSLIASALITRICLVTDGLFQFYLSIRRERCRHCIFIHRCYTWNTCCTVAVANVVGYTVDSRLCFGKFSQCLMSELNSVYLQIRIRIFIEVHEKRLILFVILFNPATCDFASDGIQLKLFLFFYSVDKFRRSSSIFCFDFWYLIFGKIADESVGRWSYIRRRSGTETYGLPCELRYRFQTSLSRRLANICSFDEYISNYTCRPGRNIYFDACASWVSL